MVASPNVFAYSLNKNFIQHKEANDYCHSSKRLTRQPSEKRVTFCLDGKDENTTRSSVPVKLAMPSPSSIRKGSFTKNLSKSMPFAPPLGQDEPVTTSETLDKALSLVSSPTKSKKKSVGKSTKTKSSSSSDVEMSPKKSPKKLKQPKSPTKKTSKKVSKSTPVPAEFASYFEDTRDDDLKRIEELEKKLAAIENSKVKDIEEIKDAKLKRMSNMHAEVYDMADKTTLPTEVILRENERIANYFRMDNKKIRERMHALSEDIDNLRKNNELIEQATQRTMEQMPALENFHKRMARENEKLQKKFDDLVKTTNETQAKLDQVNRGHAANQAVRTRCERIIAQTVDRVDNLDSDDESLAKFVHDRSDLLRVHLRKTGRQNNTPSAPMVSRWESPVRKSKKLTQKEIDRLTKTC